VTTFVMIPDYQGKATMAAATHASSIIANILGTYPRLMVVPVLNGDDQGKLLDVAKTTRSSRMLPIVGDYVERKLVGALMSGYARLANYLASDDIVVRLDTAEHDIRYIGKLAEAATEHGAVVGDLDFATGGHLREGSYDYWIHTQVFPELYAGMTGGKLRLSCAHGFQAYRMDVLRESLLGATIIVEAVEADLGTPLTWGMDGVMAIATTSKLGKGVHILPVPAQSDRDREVEKINAQLRQHAALLKAAAKNAFI